VTQPPQQDDGKILIEDAFPVYRKRCTELFDENMLLRSQVAGLHRELAAVQEASERAERAGGSPFPPSGGPDLASQPPYPEHEQQ
jgi:hypothetical protein